jgi:hypothetical protein
MKQVEVARIAAVAFAITLSTAVAQQTTTARIAASSTVSITGTITAYARNLDYITFQSDLNPTPERYYYTKDTIIRDPGGRIVTWSAVRPNLPATVYYVPEGDRLIVREILLRRPGTVYERKTITAITATSQP